MHTAIIHPDMNALKLASSVDAAIRRMMRDRPLASISQDADGAAIMRHAGILRDAYVSSLRIDLLAAHADRLADDCREAIIAIDAWIAANPVQVVR